MKYIRAETAAATCYDGLKQWRRRVQWQAGRLEVTDTVALADKKPDVVGFRWHLGTGRQVKIAQAADGEVEVTWPAARMTLTASAPIEVTQTKEANATLKHRTRKGQDHQHTCLTVRSRKKVAALRVTTVVAAQSK